MIGTPYCRPPLDELDTKFYKDVETALEAAGLIGFDLDDLKLTQHANVASSRASSYTMPEFGP